MGSNPTPSAAVVGGAGDVLGRLCAGTQRPCVLARCPNGAGQEYGIAAERPDMDTAAIRARRRERWVQRAEKVRDAFGLVLAPRPDDLRARPRCSPTTAGRRSILTVATSATSVVALTSSHAARRRRPAARSGSPALTIALAAIAAASGEHIWLNFASLIQIGLLAVAMARGPAPGRHHRRGRLAHDPRRDQRLHRARHPLHLRSTGRSTGSRAAPSSKASPTPRAATSSSSATRR